MSYKNETLLIDHLDETLQGKGLQEAEALLAADENARAEWELLQMAVASLQHEGLVNQVAAVKEQYKKATASQAVVRSFSGKIVFRVAAAILVIVLSATIYKYAITTSTGFYNDHYSGYSLSTERSTEATNLLDAAYRNQQWAEVLQAFNATSSPTNKEYFLAGMAHMELQQYDAAAKKFQAILNANQQTGDDYFNDEADYYLAMSYFAQQQADKGIAIIKRIQADNDHLYQQKALELPATDLKLLQWKY